MKSKMGERSFYFVVNKKKNGNNIVYILQILEVYLRCYECHSIFKINEICYYYTKKFKFKLKMFLNCYILIKLLIIIILISYFMTIGT